MKKEEIEKIRNYKVVKSNELIQKTKFELSLPEQKAIAYICSKIKPCKNNEYILEYEFDIREYCKICGIDYNNGKNYINVKENLKKLSDRSMWISFDNGDDVLCRWLSKVRTNKKSGIAHIKIDEDLAQYLFNLKQKFTEYELYNILGMKSGFSHRLYEILKSYEFKKNITFDLDKLKEMLNVQNIKTYVNFKDFRRRVIDVAIREINELTDINIKYDTELKGKKVIKIIFYIEKKRPLDRAIAQMTTEELINKK